MFDIQKMFAYADANRERSIDCLKEMLQIPSVTGDEVPVSLAVSKRLEAAGLTVEKFEAVENRPNLIATWKGSEKGKRFLFCSHLDVFPPDSNDPGRFGPWAGVVYEGNIYGRGATDMKGGSSASIMAITFLRELGFDFAGEIQSTWMCDEENGGGLGVKWMVSQGLMKADFGICTEPTYGRVSPVHGGILRVKVTYDSVGQHAGQPYRLGIDAIEKAQRVLGPIYELARRVEMTKSPAYGSPCLSVTKINAGDSPNVHPTGCTFWIDRRLIPGETHEAALKEITTILDDFKAKDGAFTYRLEVTSDRPILDIAEDDPHIVRLQAARQAIKGDFAPIYYMPGGSDAATIWKAHHYPIPNFGPGLLLEDCGVANEKLSVEDYLDFVKIYMLSVVSAFEGGLS